MEYIYFFVMIVSVGAVLALWAVRSARPGNLPGQEGKRDRGPGIRRSIRVERKFARGGADAAQSGIGDRLGEWVGLLLQQKRTVDDEDYRVRTNESLRALVEDRYARPSGASRTRRRGKTRRSAGPGGAIRRDDGRSNPVRTPWGW